MTQDERLQPESVTPDDVSDAARPEHEREAVAQPDRVAAGPVPPASDHARRNVITISRPLFFTLAGTATAVILALGAAVVVLAVDRGGESDPVVATVNGEQIRRSEYDRAIAADRGPDVLDSLIVERLVEAEARKRDVVVADEEAARLLEDQRRNFADDQQFQAALARAGLTEAELARQLRLAEMARRLVADQITVSDDEVAAQYNANPGQYGGQSLDQVKEQIRSSMQRQRESAAIQRLVDQLRAEAQIETHVPGKSS